MIANGNYLSFVHIYVIFIKSISVWMYVGEGGEWVGGWVCVRVGETRVNRETRHASLHAFKVIAKPR